MASQQIASNQARIRPSHLHVSDDVLEPHTHPGCRIPLARDAGRWGVELRR